MGKLPASAVLVQIAIDTGKRKIVEIISPAMTLRDNMLDVKCGEW